MQKWKRWNTIKINIKRTKIIIKTKSEKLRWRKGFVACLNWRWPTQMCFSGWKWHCCFWLEKSFWIEVKILTSIKRTFGLDTLGHIEKEGRKLRGGKRICDWNDLSTSSLIEIQICYHRFYFIFLVIWYHRF